MESPENIQPEERLESSESVEAVEEQALQDATHEPGARVEETQAFEQAEAVEEELTKSVESAEMVDVETQERLAAQDDGIEDGGDAATSIVIPDVQQKADSQQVGMEFDPIPEPPPEGQVALNPGDDGYEPDGVELNPGGDGLVAETPEPFPDPDPDMNSQASEGGQGGRPGDDVSATPINLP